MNEILHALSDALIAVLGATAPVWMPALIIVAAGATAARFGIPAVARLIDRRRRGISKEQQKRLVSLLSNARIIEFYAPSETYVVDIPEDTRGPRINAWMSPYARAVKASVKRQKRRPKNVFFDARRQIRDASNHVTVRALSETEQTSVAVDPDRPENVFTIQLDLDGRPEKDVRNLMDYTKSQLGLKEMTVYEDDDLYTLTTIGSVDRLIDPLEQYKHGTEWFQAHPAPRPTSIPMGVTSDGRTWSLSMTHTLVYGRSGSGKSGPLHAVIRQCAGFVGEDRVRLFGIDPKGEDILPCKYVTVNGKPLFQRIAQTRDDIIDLINDYAEMLTARAQNRLDSPASFHILMCDEIVAVVNELNATREGRAALTNLETVISMGRSNGFYLFFATVDSSVDKLGSLRQGCPNKIIFAQDSQHMNELFLGKEAADNGYDSRNILPATKDNGHRTSGIGYAKGEFGDPIRFRTAYQSIEDRRDWINERTSEGSPHVRIQHDENNDKLVHEYGNTAREFMHSLDAPDVEDDPLPDLEPLAPLAQTLPPPLTKRRD